MTVALFSEIREEPPKAGREMRRPLVFSLLFHLALLLLVLFRMALMGGPGPGGGASMQYRLAAGADHDKLAAPGVITAELVHAPKPKPKEEAKPEEKPQPVEKPKLELAPNPKAKIKLKEKKKKTEEKKEERKQPEIQHAQTEPPQPQLTLEQQLAQEARGLKGGTGQGGGGDAPETILNHKGTLMLGSEIATRLTGKTFHLEMGRIDVPGGNRLINTVITLHPDGTSDVTLTHYFFQTYHEQYSSTRNESGKGHWWIEGNRWCHQSPIINYNTKDCYDITTLGAEVHLYYAPCNDESSQLCKTGRLAGEGEIK